MAIAVRRAERFDKDALLRRFWLLACLSGSAIAAIEDFLASGDARLLGLRLGSQPGEFSHCYKSISARQLFDFDRRFVGGALETATGFAALHLFSSNC